jgi:uncharacterized protein
MIGMNLAQQLQELQELDLQLDRLGLELEAAISALKESPTVQQARVDCEQAEAELESRRRAAQEVDWSARDGQAKIGALEARLYGGSVASAKELATLQRDVESLKAYQLQREERLLETMISVEAAQAQVRTSREALDRENASSRANQDRARADQDALQVEIADLQARRRAQASAIDAAGLATYERLRRIKGGRAVARLAGSVCQGCRLALPSGDAARVKQSMGLVFCVNCGRILCR